MNIQTFENRVGVFFPNEGNNTAVIYFSRDDNEFLDTKEQAEKCIEHLKTIMIAVKEGADVEVVVKPKDVAGNPTSFTPNLGHPYGNIPTPAADFDHILHNTIMDLMQKADWRTVSVEQVIQGAKDICDACKITPGK